MSATLLTADNYLPVPAGAKYFTLKDDSVYYDLNGSLSYSFIPRTMSVGRNYRDEFEAWMVVFADSIVLPNKKALLETKPDGTNTTAAAAYNTDLVTADDRIAKIKPKDETLTVDFLVFWSGATGSGNVIAMFPANLFQQFSPTIPVRY